MQEMLGVSSTFGVGRHLPLMEGNLAVECSLTATIDRTNPTPGIGQEADSAHAATLNRPIP